MSPSNKAKPGEGIKPSPEKKDPPESFLKKVGKLTGDAIDKALGMSPKPVSERLHRFTPEQAKQIQDIENTAIAEFQGDLTQLEAALGMLRLGHHFGWKVLYILHSKRTIRIYEGILDIKVRELFPAEGPSTYRSYGFNIANRFSNFWKVAGGEIKIPHRQTATE